MVVVTLTPSSEWDLWLSWLVALDGGFFPVLEWLVPKPIR